MVRAISRVLSDDKVIHNRALNALGVQVLRTLASRTAFTLRAVTTDGALGSAVDALKREGLLLLPDFLPPDHFEGVLEECAQLDGDAPTMLTDMMGPNTHEAIRIRDCEDRALPQVRRFFSDRRLTGVLSAAERLPLESLALYGRWERLSQGEVSRVSGDAQEDPQTQLHSDIFFNSHKAWLFLTDVRMEDGPFVYVKRSHRLSFRSLFAIYQDSCRGERSADPSRRISPDELKRMGLTETIVTCRRNTLVIANVSGYHRRLQGHAGRQRHALSLSLRHNPFLTQPLVHGLARHARLYEFLRRTKKGWEGQSAG